MTTFPDPEAKARLEANRHSLEVAKFEAKHFSIESRLIYLAQHLPEMLPLPFSGVIALQAGEGTIVQACHCPTQPEFATDQSFNILSIGKLFTATAVMQLIEDRKFSLETPLNKLLTENEIDLQLQPPYLEEKPKPGALENFKRNAPKITLEHLLTHRSGFYKVKGTVSENWNLSKIGEFNYSNYGYQLLAIIIGKHTDSKTPLNHESSFRAHIEKRIFKPAGMERAIRDILNPTMSNPDCFEISKHGEPVKVISTEPYPHGNGCWRMPASDLLAFKRALHQHNVLLREGSLKTMEEHEPRPLGLMVDRDQETGEITGYGHPGSGRGMSSFLWMWNTDPPITAVALCNYSGCEMVKEELDRIVQS